MQPKFKMKKTLVASALILGLGNAFVASADTYTITAQAVSDVTITQHASLGDSSLSFGDKIKLNPNNNDTCILVAATNAFETDLLVNIDGNDTSDAADLVIPAGTPLTDGAAAAHVPGEIADDSTGCLGDAATGTTVGSHMVLEVDGVAGATVSVDIPDVVGTGWTYTAGDQTCVVDFDGTAAVDVCRDFDGVTSITGVGLSVGAGDTGGSVLEDNTGQTHILLGGVLVFDGTPITAGAVSDSVVVTVTYE
ncbi:hypothetical protein RT723_08095 [Psychrosphaera aquimarina]|uniref:Uncharacterized protein n=1 Tax=Psychrosphaera aquimarina TaxID=2044854 RepID=A0ABU3QZT5_9GAMM|nr:hypothetical protein [Psychrosphaera aquimarina]MDU0112956.1 hypothetical protein [Psychrosphaera aquimarina]